MRWLRIAGDAEPGMGKGSPRGMVTMQRQPFQGVSVSRCVALEYTQLDVKLTPENA
jgi:hypothetical protein